MERKITITEKTYIDFTDGIFGEKQYFKNGELVATEKAECAEEVLSWTDKDPAKNPDYSGITTDSVREYANEDEYNAAGWFFNPKTEKCEYDDWD